LFRPGLELAAEEIARAGRPVVAIGGICGSTGQAVAEAALLEALGVGQGEAE
jgi:thiamine monophosphate synthase